MTLRFARRPRLVAATFEHVLGPTKPITGVVRLKAPGSHWRASESSGRAGDLDRGLGP